MTATNRDDQLDEIYPAMLNQLKCTFGVSFSGFHCCGRHSIGPVHGLCHAGAIVCQLFQPHLGRFFIGAVLELDLVAVGFLLTVEDTQERLQLRQRKRIPLQRNTDDKQQFKA